MEFFPEDGDHQEMVSDCEVCCNPILYVVSFVGDEGQVKVRKAQ